MRIPVCLVQLLSYLRKPRCATTHRALCFVLPHVIREHNQRAQADAGELTVLTFDTSKPFGLQVERHDTDNTIIVNIMEGQAREVGLVCGSVVKVLGDEPIPTGLEVDAFISKVSAARSSEDCLSLTDLSFLGFLSLMLLRKRGVRCRSRSGLRPRIRTHSQFPSPPWRAPGSPARTSWSARGRWRRSTSRRLAC